MLNLKSVFRHNIHEYKVKSRISMHLYVYMYVRICGYIQEWPYDKKKGRGGGKGIESSILQTETSLLKAFNATLFS